MDIAGLTLCSRYSYPPNSLSLCGPVKKKEDLKWYASSQKADLGTKEILSQFATLFPYLSLIAYENDIKDPFDKRVVEAYWLGNNLMHNAPINKFAQQLSDKIQLKKKIKRKELDSLFIKLTHGALPHHSFHVLNIYKRTGHLNMLHTVQTMDACLINWGKIKKILPFSLIIETFPLTIVGNQLKSGPKKERTIMSQGKDDILFSYLHIGDFVSYHWGYFCQKLSERQLKNLIYYTHLSLKLANQTPIL